MVHISHYISAAPLSRPPDRARRLVPCRTESAEARQ